MSISVLTSVGFRQLPTKEYIHATERLRPDILIGPGDIPYGAERVSKKKIEKITDRTTKWMMEHVQARREGKKQCDAHKSTPLLYAPLLPIPQESQRWYMEHLVEGMTPDIHGLAIYDICALEGSLVPPLEPLPRLGLTNPKSPNAILREISLGIDIFTIPFIGAATDAGIAMSFSFPVSAPPSQAVSTSNTTPKPLGVDMWDPTHATDLSPLSPGCSCDACASHHRAYIQHLLAAKEMLGWVLLQTHNHAVMDRFFAGVRGSIGRASFEQDVLAFQRVYEPELPAKTGQGPR